MLRTLSPEPNGHSKMENIYQYLWKTRLMGNRITTVRGNTVDILSTGILNHDAGPDFHNARLRMDGRLWFGNVEIHVLASDWHRHHHDSDPSYRNVILHVVAVDDDRIFYKDGSEIPQTVFSVPVSLQKLYDALSSRIDDIPCQSRIANFEPLIINDWLSALSVERLQQKAQRIIDCCNSLAGDWNQACFVALARALGFNLNADPFEMLARSIPLKILHHHSDNILQLEALLFGQAGMLDSGAHMFDEYYQSLCREYFFLARKYGLKPLSPSIWKYARTRPQNFPHRRIAILAQALTNGFNLLSQILDNKSAPEHIKDIMNWKADGYWKANSDFDTPGRANSSLSSTAIDLMMINFIAPLIYAYASAHGDCDAGEAALNIWHALPPENNTYIRKWQNLGIIPLNAADSQALIQLRKCYCDCNRCLDCRFAARILRSELHPDPKTFLQPTP